MSDEPPLPDEITGETLLALPDDRLARLSQSAEGLSPRQQTSLKQAMSELTKQLRRAVARSGSGGGAPLVRDVAPFDEAGP